MPLHVRDETALQLARKLADRRGITLTSAVIEALQNELHRDKARLSLDERVRKLAADLAARGKPAKRRTVTKSEIDDLWGHD